MFLKTVCFLGLPERENVCLTVCYGSQIQEKKKKNWTGPPARDAPLSVSSKKRVEEHLDMTYVYEQDRYKLLKLLQCLLHVHIIHSKRDLRDLRLNIST